MNPPPPKACAEDNYDPRLPAQSPHPHMATGIPVNSSAAHNTQMLGPWSTGLCDCFSDMRNCCVTCWCPFITFGQIAEILDEGTMTCTVSAALYAVISATTGHACMYSCMYRTKMRQLFKLQNTPCDDCLVHWCCECCALCQEYRELQNRGFDMLIGWQGNVGRQTPGMVAMTTRAPTIEPGMRRY